MKYSIDREYLKDKLEELVRINSINPDLVEDGPGELEIAEFIHQLQRSMPIDSSLDILQPSRANVVGIIKGSGGGKSLMINAHTDTVSTKGMKDPFSAKIKNGQLYGRGAQDMKGSIAAMLTAAKALVDSEIVLKGDVIFTYVADEEYGSIGTDAILENYKADAAIVTEPTDLDICIAHKGFTVFEVKTFGRAAHGGRYWDGIDANLKMGWILVELERLSKKLIESDGHILLGKPSLHVPLIQGGNELFVYSPECTSKVEFRTIPGQSTDEIRSVIERIIKQSENTEGPKSQAELIIHRDPFEISKKATIVRTLQSCAREILRKKPVFIGHPWWEDASLISKAGIETVIIGPKGYGMHSSEEWVDIQSVVDLSQILIAATIKFCNMKSTNK